MSWAPSPALAGTVRNALSLLQAFYPRSLTMATQTTEAAQLWLFSYCRAFLGKRVSLDSITEAAQRWPAEKGKDSPYPAEFAAFCKAVEDELHPQLPQERAAERSAPLIPRPAHADAVERMSARAYAVLRSWSQVSEAWALAWECATTDALREDVRLGRLANDIWDEIIGHVHNGRVSQGRGPLSTAVRGAA